MKLDTFPLIHDGRPSADLQLRPVLAVDADGRPVLAGSGSKPMLILSDAAVPVPGMIAVCKDISDQIVVLGYAFPPKAVPAETGQVLPDEEGWVTLGCGKAQIRLHPDGRIRLKGQDVTIDSAGRLGLRGAWIDLN